MAKKADVSIACVSNILNGKKHRYSTETVERVKRIAKQENYHINIVAQSMKTKTTMTIGLILPDITNPFFPEIARGVEDRAQELGYTTLYMNTYDKVEKEKRAFTVLKQKMVDGVVFIPSIHSMQFCAIHKNSSFPVVLVDRDYDIDYVAGKVVADTYNGSVLATKLLIEKGHKKILFLSGNHINKMKGRREKGFLYEMKRAGLPISAEYIKQGEYSSQFGYAEVKKFLEKKYPLDAVFASSDMMAIGAIQALKEYGYCIPQDIAVIGFDNIELAKYIDPPLTTVNQPKYEMGREAVNILVDCIQNKKQRTTNINMNCNLVIRKSV